MEYDGTCIAKLVDDDDDLETSSESNVTKSAVICK